MGVATSINFSDGNGQPAITGDFVLIAGEVQPRGTHACARMASR